MSKPAENQEIWSQARQLHRVIRQLHSRMIGQQCSHGSSRAIDLTMPQFRALMTVVERENVSLKELAEALQVSSPSASSMTDRLVELGLLVREQNPDDRREIRLHVSGPGREALEEFENRLLSMLVDMLEQLGPDMSRDWCNIYARIESEILEQDATPSVATSGDSH